MKTILVIGTYDTKTDELSFLSDVIKQQGARVLTMDVSVLGNPSIGVDIDKHQVAQSATTSIDQIIASGDENQAMQSMSEGAATLALKLYKAAKFDAMICLGGTMGTDLALDVAMALPIGVPKYIISTVAFSPLIAIQRLAADVQMILWAGGLYGLNPICKATLSQAAGAVVGAAKASQIPQFDKPLIGITSLGKSALTYMLRLVPELEKRGFSVAVFHSTGLGGRTFETLCKQGYFACVMDFCLQELINALNGSSVESGIDRFTNASKYGIPQLVAPGATNIIDIAAAKGAPEHLAERDKHAHNRLIESVLATREERIHLADVIFSQLSKAQAPYQFLLPTQGVIEWDREGQDLYHQASLEAFNQAVLKHQQDANIKVIDGHINDPIFTTSALKIFDQWLQQGVIKQ